MNIEVFYEHLPHQVLSNSHGRLVHGIAGKRWRCGGLALGPLPRRSPAPLSTAGAIMGSRRLLLSPVLAPCKRSAGSCANRCPRAAQGAWHIPGHRHRRAQACTRGSFGDGGCGMYPMCLNRAVGEPLALPAVVVLGQHVSTPLWLFVLVGRGFMVRGNQKVGGCSRSIIPRQSRL